MTFILLTVCSIAMTQTSSTRNWVDKEVRYTDSVGRVVMIQSSLPRGGGVYTDATGKKYSYVIFWTRIVNDSNDPIELRIQFTADPYKIFSSPDSYIRLFLPPDSMTLEKVQLGDYGLDLKSFLDAGFNKPGMLQKTLDPKSQFFLYTPVLIHQAQGTARAAFVLKGEDIFYRISINPDSALIPCGRLDFKK